MTKDRTWDAVLRIDKKRFTIDDILEEANISEVSKIDVHANLLRIEDFGWIEEIGERTGEFRRVRDP